MFLDGFSFSVEIPDVVCGFLLSTFGGSLTCVACALGLQGLSFQACLTGMCGLVQSLLGTYVERKDYLAQNDNHENS